MSRTRIALDVMGGDDAPGVTLRGALRACSPRSGDADSPSGRGGVIDPSRILLVGDRAAIEAGLAEAGGNPGFDILPTTQVIEMGESPGAALRAKPDSSIHGCIGAVAKGAAGAAVSMGNTGAVVGASTLVLKTLPGVRRPGIACTFDLTGHPVTLLDMGANIAPKPQHLLQYGYMGAVFSRGCLGIEAPRVGLLNIGEEESKGTDLLKEANAALRESDLDFVGNVEGGDIFARAADVVVTDGFTGNVILKLLEGFSGFLLHLVLDELRAHKVEWGPEALVKIRKNIDYSEYGGALLLGVGGVVVIGHGRSDENAVANALDLACRALDADVNGHIVQGLSRAGADSGSGA